MNFYGKKILFIGAHPDDIELGAGALIHHLAPHCEITCVTLSDNQKNPLLKNVPNEHYQSMAVLGIPREKVILEKFETRRMPKDRQEILEYLLKLRKEIQPDLIFTHTEKDIHQDHNAITREALRAYRGITVLGFDVVRSSHGFFPNFLIGVNEQDVKAKLNALAKYKTYQDRYYFEPALLRATLIRHGALAEKPFAEGFDILRVVANFSPCA